MGICWWRVFSIRRPGTRPDRRGGFDHTDRSRAPLRRFRSGVVVGRNEPSRRLLVAHEL
jgi:hypothetical protein